MGYAVLMMVIDEALILNISVYPGHSQEAWGAGCSVIWRGWPGRPVHASCSSSAASQCGPGPTVAEARFCGDQPGARAQYPPGGREDAIVMRLT